MKTSIIVPFKNDKILTFLSNNKNLELIEVILVADGVKKKLLKTIMLNYPKFKVIVSHKKGKIGYLRNLGIRQAKGEQIYFVDDDCIISKKTIYALNSKNSAMVTKGPINFIGNTFFSKIDAKIRHNRYEQSKTFAYCPNLLVNKKIFLNYGMFNESYSYGSDGEFGKRLMDSQVFVKFDKNLVISHDCTDTFFGILRKWVAYGQGRYKRYKHCNFKTKVKSLFAPNLFCLKDGILYNLSICVCYLMRWVGMFFSIFENHDE
jgi:glycosyltransferase involved in cell wall biosynthesis